MTKYHVYVCLLIALVVLAGGMFARNTVERNRSSTEPNEEKSTQNLSPHERVREGKTLPKIQTELHMGDVRYHELFVAVQNATGSFPGGFDTGKTGIDHNNALNDPNRIPEKEEIEDIFNYCCENRKEKLQKTQHRLAPTFEELCITFILMPLKIDRFDAEPEKTKERFINELNTYTDKRPVLKDNFIVIFGQEISKAKNDRELYELLFGNERSEVPFEQEGLLGTISRHKEGLREKKNNDPFFTILEDILRKS